MDNTIEDIKNYQNEIIEHFKSICANEENVISPLFELFAKLSETDVSYRSLEYNSPRTIIIIKKGFILFFNKDMDGYENARNITIVTSNGTKFRINTKSIKRIEVGKNDFSFITRHSFDDGDSAVNRIIIPYNLA